MQVKKVNPEFPDINTPNKLSTKAGDKVTNLNTITPAFEFDKFGIRVDDIQTEADQLLKQGTEQYAELEVKPTDIIPPPKIAWQQVLNNKTAILGTLGNFSLIIGKAKSRKSFFINIAVSTVLKKDKLLNQFQGNLPHDKNRVLYFDTEQGKYHVQLALKRVCKQINEDIPKDLKVYYLRSKSPAERLNIIEQIIYNTPNLGFVVIDGIKDLVTSINDEAEATMVASKLLKWTEELDIHITTVLHQNKSDNNARGHIGTELINKSETVLSVTKNEQDKDISIVEAQLCRNIEPEPFAFEINEDGLPVIVEDFEIRTETSKSKFDITDLEDFKKYQLLTEVFSKGANHTYSELRTQLQLAYKNQYNKKLGDNRAKELITDCKNNDWLLQEKPKAPYNLGNFKGLENKDIDF